MDAFKVCRPLKAKQAEWPRRANIRLTLQQFWNEALKSQRRSVFYFCTDFEPIWTVEGQCLKKLIGERRQR